VQEGMLDEVPHNKNPPHDDCCRGTEIIDTVGLMV